MKIVSSLDKTKKWDDKNPKDQGGSDNNEYLGNWITKQLKNNLPTWNARIPDARGIENKEDKPLEVVEKEELIEGLARLKSLAKIASGLTNRSKNSR